jgi:hypothetical protein
MNEIFKKFADICHGGAQVSNKEVEDEKKKMETAAKIAMNAAKSIPGRNSIAVNQRKIKGDWSKALVATTDIIKEFQKKFNSGGFKYCDCFAFAASIGKTNWFNSNLNSLCLLKPKATTPVAVVRPVSKVDPFISRTVGRRKRIGGRALVLSQTEELEKNTKALEDEIDQLE